MLPIKLNYYTLFNVLKEASIDLKHQGQQYFDDSDFRIMPSFLFVAIINFIYTNFKKLQ